MRARDRRRDGGLEDEAAAARVVRAVLRAPRRAEAALVDRDRPPRRGRGIPVRAPAPRWRGPRAGGRRPTSGPLRWRVSLGRLGLTRMVGLVLQTPRRLEVSHPRAFVRLTSGALEEPGRLRCDVRHAVWRTRSARAEAFAILDARDGPRTQAPIRLVVALSAAVLLAGALVYTSFSASSEARTPSQLLRRADAGPRLPAHRQGRGRLGPRRTGDDAAFRVRDRNGTASVPVRYTGAVPDPFREGREVIVDGAQAGRRRSSARRTRWSPSARRSSPRQTPARDLRPDDGRSSAAPA